MSDEDPTKPIGPLATPPTQPTIETVIEHINQLGEALNERIDEAVAELRKVEDQLSVLNAKIEILRPV